VAVNVVVRQKDGTIAVALLRFMPPLFAPNTTLPFDLGGTFGALAKFDGLVATPLAIMGKGSVMLAAAGTTPGTAVSGSFTASLLSWPF
jgi:hypothetical protein